MFEETSFRSEHIGVITHGSLNEGIEMKLAPYESVEAVVAGTFVVIQGEKHDFFCMITDVEIEAANEQILLNPPDPSNDLLREVMQGSGTYVTVQLKPMLMMPNTEHPELREEEPKSVKTIAAHFSPVAQAEADDVARVFGDETWDDGRTYFHVGHPIGMKESPVCTDLTKFAERSNAIFGKRGTGKTFLTRLLLAGTIRTGRAVNLVFDMHSEYGYGSQAEGEDDQAQFVKGFARPLSEQGEPLLGRPLPIAQKRSQSRLRGASPRRSNPAGRHPSAAGYAESERDGRGEQLSPQKPVRRSVAYDAPGGPTRRGLRASGGRNRGPQELDRGPAPEAGPV